MSHYLSHIFVKANSIGLSPTHPTQECVKWELLLLVMEFDPWVHMVQTRSQSAHQVQSQLDISPSSHSHGQFESRVPLSFTDDLACREATSSTPIQTHTPHRHAHNIDHSHEDLDLAQKWLAHLRISSRVPISTCSNPLEYFHTIENNLIKDEATLSQ